MGEKTYRVTENMPGQKTMAVEVMVSKVKSTTDTLLNGHVVKVHSKYLCL